MPGSSGFDLSRTFEPSPNAMVVVDRAHNIVAANRAFLDLTGTAWPAIEATSLSEVLSDQHHIVASNTPILDDAGEAGWLMHQIADRAAIDEARRDHDELVVRAAYEEKLIGIVSHDLRNPLGAIALAVPMLERDQLSAQAKKAIGFINAAVSRSERLIADLLDFAQARNGSFPIVPGPTALSSLVRAAVDTARVYVGPRAVVLDHRGPATGRWDEGRLTQVIANLVGNAFQHAPPNAIIRVRSAIEGDRAWIEVFNEGPVIAAEDLPRMFDPFARGKNAATKQGRSVGLGLYIARQITLAHGGEIEVASVEGVGTTFTVRLPTNTPVT